MNGELVIAPVNIAIAAIIIQIAILSIMLTAVFLHNSTQGDDNSVFRNEKGVKLEGSAVAVSAIVSLAVLALSDSLLGLSSPVFGGSFGWPGFARGDAILTMFLIDFGTIVYLIQKSDGSDESPLTPLLFTIPALAIFLRLSASHFISLAVIAALIYIICRSRFLSQRGRSQPSSSARVVTNLLCLALAMTTGYFTKPTPIEDSNQSVVPYSSNLETSD